MNYYLLALTFDLIAKLLLAFALLLVHHRLIKDRKIDMYVLKDMKIEQAISAVAITLLLIAYLIKVFLLDVHVI